MSELSVPAAAIADRFASDSVSSIAQPQRLQADLARTQTLFRSPANVQPEPSFTQEFALPRSGSQLYQQRVAALRAGRLFTRLPMDSFRQAWSRTRQQPSYREWRRLLALEARAVARGQGRNRLAVLVGDSLSLWFPSDRLPTDQLWLNQAMSGDTTRGVLQRLRDFAHTRPDAIYIMAGVNDVKRGASDREILGNLQQMMQRLQRVHPKARIVVQSILPTRSSAISSQRIWQLNQQLASIAQQQNALYLDLFSQFADEAGQLQQAYTTDGVHLNPLGYETWRSRLEQAHIEIAQGR
ncbi:lysophospholipase [Leptolyngbya sp. FACHB-36]|uniref:GDSL-type esterase/lipase family protein n=1 Tax=Leptolyngbya sp. FACHB-36 TaxID=2692808 RepID=UPI00168134E0|nr:GDSL-type esterase/lipase family protein [Leptolyngbya sp. FACHB-36]MBD2020417.1 lysophospholipase [Leptolyngbya sp. FACHB-36]